MVSAKNLQVRLAWWRYIYIETYQGLIWSKSCVLAIAERRESPAQRFWKISKFSEMTRKASLAYRVITLHWQLRFIIHPDFLYFWYHLNDHSSATTLGILIRITHNQDMTCIFVVCEAQLLAIPVAKDLGGSRFHFFDKIFENFRKMLKMHWFLKEFAFRRRDLNHLFVSRAS